MSMTSLSCILYPWAWGEKAALQFKNCSTSAHFPCTPMCMWSVAGDILEHPISQVRQYDALWKSLCQGRKAEGRWEGYSCFTKSTNYSQTQKRLSTAWLQKEFNIPFSRVNDADQRSCVWKDKLSLLSPSLPDLKEKVWKITVLQELPTPISVGKILFCQASFLISKYYYLFLKRGTLNFTYTAKLASKRVGQIQGRKIHQELLSSSKQSCKCNLQIDTGRTEHRSATLCLPLCFQPRSDAYPQPQAAAAAAARGRRGRPLVWQRTDIMLPYPGKYGTRCHSLLQGRDRSTMSPSCPCCPSPKDSSCTLSFWELIKFLVLSTFPRSILLSLQSSCCPGMLLMAVAISVAAQGGCFQTPRPRVRAEYWKHFCAGSQI